MVFCVVKQYAAILQQKQKEISLQFIFFLFLVSPLKRLSGKDHQDIVKYLLVYYIERNPSSWFDSSIDQRRQPQPLKFLEIRKVAIFLKKIPKKPKLLAFHPIHLLNSPNIVEQDPPLRSFEQSDVYFILDAFCHYFLCFPKVNSNLYILKYPKIYSLFLFYQ